MAGRVPRNLEVLARRIERYRDAPDGDTPAALLGRALWRGQELTTADGVALGRSGSLVYVVCKDFERAGYPIRRRRIPGTNARGLYLEGAPDDVRRDPTPDPPPGRRKRPPPTTAPLFENAVPNPPGAALERVAPLNGVPRAPLALEVPGIAYPALGALLGVRAVALVDGALVLHLADADGGVWQTRVTGHAPG